MTRAGGAGALALCVVWVASLAGCPGVSRLFESKEERAADDLRGLLAPRVRASDAAFASIDVPDGVATDPRSPAFRILVDRGAIRLDALPPVADRFGRLGPAFLLGRDPATLVPPAIRSVATLHDGLVAPADKQGGEHGFLIRALAAALEPIVRDERAAATAEGRDPSDAVALVVARDVPYRTVAEVVYTAGQARLEELSFALRDGAIVVRLPGLDDEVVANVAPLLGEDAPEPTTARRLDAHGDEPLRVEVVLGAEGARLTSFGMPVRPGCVEAAPDAGVTVPAAHGRLDAAGLGACARALVPALGDRGRVTLGAARETPFGDVAAALFALRGPASAPRVSRVLLSAPAD